jgi:hypothetical protein
MLVEDEAVTDDYPDSESEVDAAERTEAAHYM